MNRFTPLCSHTRKGCVRQKGALEYFWKLLLVWETRFVWNEMVNRSVNRHYGIVRRDRRAWTRICQKIHPRAQSATNTRIWRIISWACCCLWLQVSAGSLCGRVWSSAQEDLHRLNRTGESTSTEIQTMRDWSLGQYWSKIRSVRRKKRIWWALVLCLSEIGVADSAESYLIIQLLPPVLATNPFNNGLHYFLGRARL